MTHSRNITRTQTIINAVKRPALSLKTQALATIAAIIGAVALPQVFHVIGIISGAGTVPGEIFLPMHLPIMLVGLLAGPYVGAIAGLCGPLASFALTGMPGSAMLPFMMIELCVYGLSAGMLRTVKMPTVGKVVVSQIAGRIVRAAAILLAVNVFGNTAVSSAIIWNSIITGVPGLVLQWCMLPLIVFYVDNITKNEQ